MWANRATHTPQPLALRSAPSHDQCAPPYTPNDHRTTNMPKEPPRLQAGETSTPNLKPMPPPKEEANFRTLRLFLCGTITWAATIIACLGPFSPLYMKEEYHTSTTMVSLIFSVTSIVQFLTCPFVGAPARLRTL